RADKRGQGANRASGNVVRSDDHEAVCSCDSLEAVPERTATAHLRKLTAPLGVSSSMACRSSVECHGRSGRPSLFGVRKNLTGVLLMTATCSGSEIGMLLSDIYAASSNGRRNETACNHDGTGQHAAVPPATVNSLQVPTLALRLVARLAVILRV